MAREAKSPNDLFCRAFINIRILTHRSDQVRRLRLEHNRGNDPRGKPKRGALKALSGEGVLRARVKVLVTPTRYPLREECRDAASLEFLLAISNVNGLTTTGVPTC